MFTTEMHSARRWWEGGGLRADLLPYLVPALQAGADLLKADLAARTQAYGRISTGWATAVEKRTDNVTGAITNAHPGAGPLNNGAQWTGAMPPWGPPGSGQLSFAAAHTLKYGNPRTGRPPGLAARHWTQDALAAHQAEIAALVHDRGVQRFVRALFGGT
jgi:hypothetical protein